MEDCGDVAGVVLWIRQKIRPSIFIRESVEAMDTISVGCMVMIKTEFGSSVKNFRTIVSHTSSDSCSFGKAFGIGMGSI